MPTVWFTCDRPAQRAPKVGRPKRDRGKNKAQRQARKRTR